MSMNTVVMKTKIKLFASFAVFVETVFQNRKFW